MSPPTLREALAALLKRRRERTITTGMFEREVAAALAAPDEGRPMRVCPGCRVPFGLAEPHSCPGYSFGAPASPEPRPARCPDPKCKHHPQAHGAWTCWAGCGCGYGCQADGTLKFMRAASPEPEGTRAPNMRLSELPRADIGPKGRAARANAASEGKSLAAGDGAHEAAAADGPTSTHRTPAPEGCFCDEPDNHPDGDGPCGCCFAAGWEPCKHRRAQSSLAPASPPSPAPRGNPLDFIGDSRWLPCGCIGRCKGHQEPAPSPAPEPAPCPVGAAWNETTPRSCFSCGAIVEPTPCHCGAMHVGAHCWPCHHKNYPDGCAAPHCPDHGYLSAKKYLKCRAPAPSSPAPKEEP